MKGKIDSVESQICKGGTVIISEKYFFEIAVYKSKEDVYNSEMERERQEYLSKLMASRDEAPDSYAFAEKWFDEKNWYPWRYNQIIGWLRLYILGTQVRAEYFFIDAKRITRRIKDKKFLWCGKAFELNFDLPNSSSTIYSGICKALKGLSKKHPFKKGYIDLEAFYQIGPFVNWRTLIGLD